MSINHTPTCVLALASALLLPAMARSQDLRIESEVFIGSEKLPVAENLTLFSGGVVYDFLLTEPEEITVFDPQRSRFVLLETTRRIRTTLTLDQLREFTEAIRAEAQGKEQDFFLHPQFDSSFDQETGYLTLSSPHLTYRAKGVRPSNSSAVGRYQQFADWSARLNATRPGILPPFARIELNRAMAQQGIVPEEVQLTIIPKSMLMGKKFEARSRHLIIWDLSKTDQKRIETVGDNMASYEPVSFQDYRQKTRIAARDSR